MPRLLKSAKFWTMIIDVVISLTVYFVSRYGSPKMAEDALFVIATLQPVALAVIVGIFVEDANGDKKLVEALTAQLSAFVRVDDDGAEVK